MDAASKVAENERPAVAQQVTVQQRRSGQRMASSRQGADNSAGLQSGLRVRCCDAGCAASSAGGRIGRGVKLPRQFGQTPTRTSRTQSTQNVHSNVQIIA
jgi:hypothetical protein